MKKIRLAIVRSRNFRNYVYMKKAINDIYSINKIECIVSGGARGADTLVERFSMDYKINMIIHRAEWDKYEHVTKELNKDGTRKKNPAGMIRNKKMIKDSTDVIAFWDGKSRETKNSINLAREMGKKLTVVNTNDVF